MRWYTINRHRWVPELREWAKIPNKQKPMAAPKTEENETVDDDDDAESVIVYEEVIVEV